MSNIIIWLKQPLILKIKMSSFCTMQYIITVLSIIIVFIFKFELIPVSELQVSILYAKSFHIETCRKLLHNEHRSQGLVTWSFSTFLKTSWRAPVNGYAEITCTTERSNFISQSTAKKIVFEVRSNMSINLHLQSIIPSISYVNL